MLSFLSCAAQGLPVVYIPRAGDWVTAAKEGWGDAFFLSALLKQNAGACPCKREVDPSIPVVLLVCMRHMAACL